MTVTTAEFEALTPIPYSQARAQMRTGDILLFHSSGLGSALIEYATHSLWCHAGFVWNVEHIDRVLLLESVDTYGVRSMSLSNKINGSTASPKPYPGKLLLARHQDFPHPAPAADVRKMTGFAIDRLGFPYSTEELARVAERIAAGMAGISVRSQLDPTRAYICSEYVAKSYEAMGLTLAPDKAGYIAPADIANDPKVFAVCAICPDPAPSAVA